MGSLQRGNNHHSSHHMTDQIVHPFLTIQREVDKALHGFYDLFEHKPFNLTEIENTKLAPLMDLAENKDSYKIELEMPGLDEEDITVSLHENVLTICGEKTTSKKNQRKNYLSREINYGRYERNISLPLSADGSKAVASFKKGMLWITIPKKQAKIGSKRKIKITKAV